MISFNLSVVLQTQSIYVFKNSISLLNRFCKIINLFEKNGNRNRPIKIIASFIKYLIPIDFN